MENHSEKIQDYIDGYLEGDELIQFEAQLAVDDELRNMCILQKEVHNILNKRVLSKEMELRGNLNSFQNNFRYDCNAKIINFRKLIPVVLGFSVLIGGLLFYVFY